MHKSFFLSDTHFSHNNILNFKDENEKLIRPFKTIEEHDELIIENINKRVRSVDRIYLMGDVVIHCKAMSILNRINGRKVLIKGNHDIFALKYYTPYFQDIRAYKVFPEYGIVFSHIPIHPGQLVGRFKLNCHGHLHHKVIDDIKYMNLCCEHLNYNPIEMEEILDQKKDILK